MEFTLSTDDLGRLSCSMSDGGAVATVTASDRPAASSALLEAVDGAARNGYGECYWLHTGGEYRWMLRRDGEQVRIAVLWSNGTLTGWEHVFWSECLFAPFASQVRTFVDRRE